MAYYNTYNNVQFLDLSGVDEEEKKWILTSLHEHYPCVEGPWSKGNEMIGETPTAQPECTNINNGIPPMSYEQYPSPPVIISNHVSPISAQVYPQSYQATAIPMYQPAFVPQVQYGAPIMPVVPATMMPVNAPIMSFGGQPVTYATYQPPIQASPIYNMPPGPQMVKDSAVKINMNPHQQYHHNHHHNEHSQQQEFCNTVQPSPQQQQHVVMPIQHHQQQAPMHSTPTSHSSQSPVGQSNLQPQQSVGNNTIPVVKPTQPPPTQQQSQPQVQSKEPSPISNGPVRNPSPIECNKNVTTSTNQTLPVVTNGHDDVSPIHANGIGSVAAVSPTETLSVPSETQTSPNDSSRNPAATAETGGTMSWASLFNKKNNVTHSEHQVLKNTNIEQNTKLVLPPTNDTKNTTVLDENRKKSPLAEIGDPNYYRMGEVLVNYTPDNKITSLQPRGLINRRYYCYINSILQALLACPPMYNLLHALGQNVTNEYRKHTHIIDNLVKFVNEFNLLPAAQRVGRRSDKVQKKEQNVVVTYDRPFEPNWIHKMLNGMQSDSFVVEGRQEDAEEFLGCLLNGLNDEMLELMKLVGANVDSAPEPVVEDGYKSDSDREWQVIGPKNKGCITRRTEIVRTPISDIFGGHIRSKIHRAGDQITNNIQPFFTLQLNIEKVNTVREALEALVCKNQLEGVTSSKTNEKVEAWQQVTIEELPVVLILHLKCFDFKMDGCKKIVKALEFPVDLKIDAKLLSQKTNYQAKEKQYKLFAVVYHDGKEATNGHYLTDAYHVGYATWLRFDDASVKTVQEEEVLKPHGIRVPYLLFYRRCDTVRNK